MPTARDLINLSFKQAGILGVGQTLLAEDVNDGFTLFKSMIAQWQKRRWMVPSLYDVSAIGNGERSNLIGPGKHYNAPRPDKIQAAYIVQRNTGPDPISIPLRQVFAYEDYANIAVKSLNSLPGVFFYDAHYPYGNVYLWPIPSNQYEAHLIIKSNIGLETAIAAGEIVTGGTGYTDGTVASVPFTNEDDTGASGGTATITVAGGIVTTVTLPNPNNGNGYNVGDLLSVLSGGLIGAGTGFSYRVTNTSASLDSELNMPPEFEEAIRCNLCVRLGPMYQRSVDPANVALAKKSLNTIRIANVQVPKLQMPDALWSRRAFNIWNADGF